MVVSLFVASALHQAQIARAHPLFLIGSLVQPIAFLLIVLNTRDVHEPQAVMQYAVAILLISYWGSTVWQGANILQRERRSGTLKVVIRGVHHPLVVLLGKAFGATTAPAILATVTIVAVVVANRLPVHVESPAWFAVGMVTVLVSGTALGTLLCSVFLLTRHGNHLSSALLYPVYLLSGLLIPVTFWPDAIGWVSAPVSLRWVNTFLSSTTSGSPDFAALAIAWGLTAVYGVLGYLAFANVLTHVKKKGTMDVG